MAENINLIEFRKTLGLNQDEMAKKLDISSSFYAKIELGYRNPSFNFMKKIKKVFNANIDTLFFNQYLH